MGAQQSSEPRSVSMDNPNPSGVIDVSDDVVQRLKMGFTQQIKDKAAAEHAEEGKSSQSQKQQEKRAIPVKSSPASPSTPAPAPVPAARSPPIVFQNPTPAYMHAAPGSTITALEMRRQKEIELQQNDDMWRERLSQQEEVLKKTDAILEKEYNVAMNDVRERFAHPSSGHQSLPCQDLKAKVIACYRENPGETLRCAQEVCMFRHCVSMQRLNLQTFDAHKEDKNVTVQPPVNAGEKDPANAA